MGIVNLLYFHVRTFAAKLWFVSFDSTVLLNLNRISYTSVIQKDIVAVHGDASHSLRTVQHRIQSILSGNFTRTKTPPPDGQFQRIPKKY